MLQAAVKFIKKKKVKVIEAYPVTLTKAGKRLPAAFSFTGPIKMFTDEGFEITQRLTPTQPLVCKSLER